MYEIALSYVRQHEDTNEWGDDEPYVVIFAADLSDTGLIPLPAAASTLNGPYEMGTIVGMPVPARLCWGFDGQPRDIDNPDDPLILVALLESDHDDSPADFANSVRGNSHGLILASLSGYIVAHNQGTMNLATIRSRLIDDMRGAVDTFISADLEHDERLGAVQRLVITAEDLINAQSKIIKKNLTFTSNSEDSKYELTFSIGTGVGSVSSGLSSSGPTDRYAAIWVKGSGPEMVARHRMTSDEYQAEFNKWTSQGFRLVRISGYNFGGKVHFAAIWEKSSSNAWLSRHNMTSSQYQDEFNKQAKAGYRLDQVSGYSGPGGDMYAAIWKKEAGPEWVARHRMTSSQYQSEFNKLAQQGYRVVDISVYRIAGKERYAAIWEKKSDFPWVARHNMTSANYQKEFDKLSKEGYRLVHVTGSSICGRQRYAAIWEKSAGSAWVTRHNMTSEKYQEEFTKYMKQGYRLLSVSGC